MCVKDGPQKTFPLDSKKYDMRIGQGAFENSIFPPKNHEYLWYNYFQYVAQN